jgi:hypothetical protein
MRVSALPRLSNVRDGVTAELAQIGICLHGLADLLHDGLHLSQIEVRDFRRKVLPVLYTVTWSP